MLPKKRGAGINIVPARASANYLRFMERGRINRLRMMSVEQHSLFEQAHKEAPELRLCRALDADRFSQAGGRGRCVVVVKRASITLARLRVAFVSKGRAQPIPKSLRLLMKADPV